MRKLLWRIEYVWRLMRSPWSLAFSVREAWQESGASWDVADDWRGDDPMPNPAEALYDDQQNWIDA